MALEGPDSAPGSPRIDATFDEWLDDYVAQNLQHGVWAAGVARPSTDEIAQAVRDDLDAGDAMELLRWLVAEGEVAFREVIPGTIRLVEAWGRDQNVPPHLVDIARQLTTTQEDT